MVDEKLREEKDRVKQFYETFGWRRNAAGAFLTKRPSDRISG
jgi:hypothetical protein